MEEKQQSRTAGEKSGDKEFDTIELASEVFAETVIPRISKLAIFYRDETYPKDPYVLGIAVQYLSDGDTYSTQHATVKYTDFWDRSVLEIVLDDDEYITDVAAGYGWYVDRLEITTSKGRVHGVGNNYQVCKSIGV